MIYDRPDHWCCVRCAAHVSVFVTCCPVCHTDRVESVRMRQAIRTIVAEELKLRLSVFPPPPPPPGPGLLARVLRKLL